MVFVIGSNYMIQKFIKIIMKQENVFKKQGKNFTICQEPLKKTKQKKKKQKKKKKNKKTKKNKKKKTNSNKKALQIFIHIYIYIYIYIYIGHMKVQGSHIVKLRLLAVGSLNYTFSRNFVCSPVALETRCI